MAHRQETCVTQIFQCTGYPMTELDMHDIGRFVISQTGFAGLLVIQTKPVLDHRGEFTRMYCQDEFSSIELSKPIVQINKSKTLKPGTIRGLHFQSGVNAEDKIVSCIAGKVFDVAVDIRPESKTFLSWFGIELSSENNISLLIPAGFAHGFQSIDENSEIIYFVTNKYNSMAENGIHPLDASVNIKWPLDCSDMSDKDANHPFISNQRIFGN
jgi:dTDP-4-dehydrorhamnose 3,5-epimerase